MNQKGEKEENESMKNGDVGQNDEDQDQHILGSSLIDYPSQNQNQEDSEMTQNQQISQNDNINENNQIQEQEQIQIKQIGGSNNLQSLSVNSDLKQSSSSVNAPIELKKKNEEEKEDQPMISSGIEIKNSKVNDEIQKQRERMQKVAKKIFIQCKTGCKKDLCLNMNCKTNFFAKSNLEKMKGDSDILVHAMKLLQASKSDPDSILCSESKTINKENIDSFSDEELIDVLEDFFQFSCSFVDLQVKNQIISQNLQPIYQCSIDFFTLQKFYSRVRAHCETINREILYDKLNQLMDILDNELGKPSKNINIEYVITAIRCFTMLLLMQEMENQNFHPIFERIVQMFKYCNEHLRRMDDQQASQYNLDFIKTCMPKEQIIAIIQKFQLYITILIMENNFRQEVIQWVIEVMDLFYQSNKMKPKKERVPDSEFYNDSLNNDVDLKKQASIFYNEWNAKKQLNQDYDRYSGFNLYNYPWTLNAYRKAELFRIIANQNRHEMIGQAIFQNFGALFDHNSQQNPIHQILNTASFAVKIRRDHILEDSLNALVQKADNLTIRKPLRVYFENEPAIDEGGVKKEFFQLLFKELFNPCWGMFMYNPDNRLYYFNGHSFESPINFELIGTLMGLAPQNQVILDIPILSTCYKILLDKQPDFDDLVEWQPEIAKSFKYILEYEEETPLEDVLARTFTIDLEIFGEKVTENLKKDGDKIYVTKENRQEFIDLYIDHLFIKQCEKQIDAFKRGFYKLFDKPMLKLLYTPEELEQFVCGTKNLDFKQLQRITKYMKPLHPQHEVVIWFWDIVFNDFNDTQRKQLLAFTTGSDRAPITGLEDIEFIIGIEGEDEEKLPTAHTCFNQLLFPLYKSREKMASKLKQAVENCEGFGMV